MICKNKNGLLFYQFEHLAKCEGLVHGIFTRKGGYSLPPYDSLNVGNSVGDDEEKVSSNIDKICRSLEINNRSKVFRYNKLKQVGQQIVGVQNFEALQAAQNRDLQIQNTRKFVGGYLSNELPKLISLKQVHGANVVLASEAEKKRLEADAIVSLKAGQMLLIKTADCQAVLLYDPKQKIAANIHSGWRGSIKNIAGKTIEFMRQLGSNPKNILAGIGPSLGPCCAEFINYKKEIPSEFWKYQTRPFYFNFWDITYNQLCDAGLISENIYQSKICTSCEKDLFFSYRKEKLTGRLAAVIGFK